jgi:peptide/nickel transport system permease protein
MVLLTGVVIIALLAPFLGHGSPDSVNVFDLDKEPSAGHWFGTDYLGRDMWTRVIYGGRTSLAAGMGVILIAFGIGTPLGLIAGYIGGVIDDLIMRCVDLLLCFPFIILTIGIVAVLGAIRAHRPRLDAGCP